MVANTLPMPPNVLKTTRKVLASPKPNPNPKPKPNPHPKPDQVRQLSVGKLLAQVITCIHTGDSVSGMFDVKKAGVLLA